MSDKLQYTDIAEAGALKPLQDELIATIKLFNQLEGDVKAVAVSVKGMLASSSTSNTDGLKKIAESSKLAGQAMTEQDKITKELNKTNAKLNETISGMSDELARAKVELQAANAAQKENAKLSSDQIGAYDKASITLQKNIKAWKDLAIIGKENSAVAKKLKTDIDALDATLKRVDAATGRHTRNVGNYSSAFNGLNNSINQLTREMPAFANSAQTGFMALSNNIPMLVDQIEQLKTRNAELNLEGKKGTPIWKALAGSLFSFQTLMGVAITAMVLYGKEIGIFFKELFKGKEIIDAYKMTKEQLLEVDKAAAKSAVEENVNLTILLATAKDVNLSLAQRKEAVDELQKTYPAYFANLKDEEILAGDTAAAERTLRDAILSKAKAQASTSKIIENEGKLLDLTQKRAELNKQIADQETKAKEQERLGQLRGGEFGGQSGEIAQAKLNELKKEQIQLDKEIAATNKVNQALLGNVIENTAAAAGLDDKTTKAVVKRAVKAQKDIDDAAQKQAEAAEKDRRAALAAKLDEDLEAYKQHGDKIIDVNTRTAEQQLFAITKQRRKEAKEEAQARQNAIRTLENATQEQLALKEKQIDREISLSERRQNELRDLAMRGSQDAQNNLAFEERKQAELEAKRLKAQKNQRRQELLFAGLRAYSANVEKNPSTALGSTLKDITVLTSALAALPGFIEGTENVAKSLGKPHLSGKDGYVVRVDGSERIVNPEHNRMIGDLTNDELATLASRYNMGLISPTSFDKMPLSRAYNDDRLLDETRGVKESIEQLKSAIENRPVVQDRFNEVEKYVEHVITTKHKTEVIKRKGGGLRG